ncbi:MAG: hypothetical protein ACOCP8_07380 [archaeon]
MIIFEQAINLISEYNIYYFISLFNNNLLTIEPNSTYLTLTGSFSITVLAIAIPLSIDAIGRLSSRYKSNVITSLFNSEKENFRIKTTGIFLISLVLIISFFNPEDDNLEILWNLIYFLTLFLNMYMIILLFKFYKKLIKYFLNTSYAFNKLIEIEQDIIEKKQVKKDEKTELLDINEGLGDILIYTSKVRKNEVVKNYLGKYNKMIKNLFNLLETDYDKFINIVISDEFLEELKDNKKNARYIPEEQFTNLKIIINQYTRLHENTKFENKEISSESIYFLSDILKKISKHKNISVLIRIVLERLFKLFNQNIDTSIDTKWLLGVRWYIRYFRLNKNDFYYLDLYNKNFKKCISLIIKNDKAKLFKSLVSSLIDGISVVYKNNTQPIYNYTGLLIPEKIGIYRDNNLDKRVKDIINNSKKIYTKNDFNEWNKEINKIKELIINNINSKELNKDKLNEIEEKIYRWGRDNLKFNNIMIISCYIGAYSLFVENYYFIKEMWNYKQPFDANASYAGHNVYPESMNKIFSLILDYKIFRERFAFYEGHHDISPYMKKYIVLLIYKIFIVKEDLKKPNIKNKNSIELSNMKHIIEQLKKLNNNIIKNKDIIKSLELNVTEDINIINKKIDAYFEEILESISKQQENILIKKELSNKKINEFKKSFYKNYYDNADIKNMLNDFGLIKLVEYDSKDELEEYIKKNKIIKRGIFIENWYVDFSVYFTSTGQEFANYENELILKKITTSNFKEVKSINSENISDEFINEIINNMKLSGNDENKLIMFMTGPDNLSRYLSDIDNYKVRNSIGTNTLKVGYYHYNEKKIPVFCFRFRDVKNQILIINQNKMGNLDQFILTENMNINQYKKENLKYLFEFEILDLSNEKERKEYIDKSGYNEDEDKLKDKVSVLIRENFNFKYNNEKHGYKINVKNCDIK